MWKELWIRTRYNCYLNIKIFKMLGKSRIKVFIFGKIWSFDFQNHGFII